MSTGVRGQREGLWTVVAAIAGIIGTIAAIVFSVAAWPDGGDENGAAAGQGPATGVIDSPAPPPASGVPTRPSDDSTRSQPDPEENPSNRAAEETFLSEIRIVDHDVDSSTGGWEEGAKDINGEQYGHSLLMYAGCQNDDGGDYWVDLTIGTGWRQLSGTVGSDRQLVGRVDRLLAGSGSAHRQRARSRGPEGGPRGSGTGRPDGCDAPAPVHEQPERSAPDVRIRQDPHESGVGGRHAVPVAADDASPALPGRRT